MWRKAAAGHSAALSWLMKSGAAGLSGVKPAFGVEAQRGYLSLPHTDICCQVAAESPPNTSHWWLVRDDSLATVLGDWLSSAVSKFRNDSMRMHYTDKTTKQLWFHDLPGLRRMSNSIFKKRMLVPSFAGCKVTDRNVIVSSCSHWVLCKRTGKNPVCTDLMSPNEWTQEVQ